MQRGKIAFGKINLNLNKPQEKKEENVDTEKATTSTGGFKKIDKQQMQKQIDEVSEDLEAQKLKEVMGLTGFGRKAAKVFDINVRFLKTQKKIFLSYNKYFLLGTNCQS